jgi:hypothetical protein
MTQGNPSTPFGHAANPLSNTPDSRSAAKPASLRLHLFYDAKLADDADNDTALAQNSRICRKMLENDYLVIAHNTTHDIYGVYTMFETGKDDFISTCHDKDYETPKMMRVTYREPTPGGYKFVMEHLPGASFDFLQEPSIKGEAGWQLRPH